MQGSEENINSLTAERNTLQETYNQTLAQVEQLTQAKTKLERRVEVGRTIREKFGTLASLWDKGLIDVGDREGEDLESYLGELHTELSAIADGKVRNAASGSTPPPPKGGEPPAPATQTQLYQEMQEAERTHGFNSPERAAAYDKWLAVAIQAEKK